MTKPTISQVRGKQTTLQAVRLTTTSGHTWTTSVNGECSRAELIEYFVGTVFDVGSYPVEQMKECVQIVFLDGNPESTVSGDYTMEGQGKYD